MDLKSKPTMPSMVEKGKPPLTEDTLPAELPLILENRQNARRRSSVSARRRSSIKLLDSGNTRFERTLSTRFRLELQGLEPLTRQTSFAVRSVHRGSDDWAGMLRPFVSDLVFQSIASRRSCAEDAKNLTFRPYTCQAAVLFVDLSGYSKITAAIAHKGAHVISAAVNAYLERLLEIIYEFGGDVIKFAGDAILVVWEGLEAALELNVLCAAQCAEKLQEKAGEHRVDGTDHKFQIHCGLCCGVLESEVFEAPIFQNMQRLYHYVGGGTMAEIGDLVDLAKSGETAISQKCLQFIKKDWVQFKPASGGEEAILLKCLKEEVKGVAETTKWHIKMIMDARRSRRDRSIEEDFIHPSVLAQLSHGGESPTQIAQMRNLCVLFIGMTSNGDSVNWLLEIQAVLERNRCPIVQIIFDDKGVHIVAAVNLYESVPEASIFGLEVCRELKEKRVGATVGAALGQTFCGVTGSFRACRWDITGPAVVRAARLMQYALNEGLPFAIDQSLYEIPTAATRMLTIREAVSIKGSPHPIPVYTISDSKSFCAFGILDKMLHGGIHVDKVLEIQNHVTGRNRSVVVVTGISKAGMRMVCQRVAGLLDFVPYRHRCEDALGFMQLATTIATWFTYVEDKEVRGLADGVLQDMKSGCFSCAHDQCVRLVNLALEKGLRACFVVDQIENLDKFSLSLIRACQLSPTQDRKGLRSVSSDSLSYDPLIGNICFLCVHRPSYRSRSAEDLVQDICRSFSYISIPIIEVGQATKDELRAICNQMMDIEVEDRWLDCYAEASGFCAEYFLERAEAVHHLSAEMWQDGRPALVELGEDLILHIPPGELLSNRELQVTQIRAETAMRFSQLYDEAPPQCQMLLKVVTIGTRCACYKLPYKIIWETLNDVVARGIERNVLDNLIEEMVEIHAILCEEAESGSEDTKPIHGSSVYHRRVLSIQSPALADVCMGVCTPDQVQKIARKLIDRLEAIMLTSFQVPFALAGLHLLVEETPDTVAELWGRAYQAFLAENTRFSDHEIAKWKEIFSDEISSAGFDPAPILGEKFSFAVEPKVRAPPCIAMLKTYSAPVSLGPMGMSLSVICRNTVLEYGCFHGECSAKEGASLLRERESAANRYILELSVLENFLQEMEVGGQWEEVQAEADIMSFLAKPSGSSAEVQTKAVIILDEVIPRFVEYRRQRLYKLVGRLKENNKSDTEGTPKILEQLSAPKAIRKAYQCLQTNSKSRMDAAQDALMTLATMGWKPPRIPEHLPLLHYPTVVNLRNKTMRRLNEVELLMYRHQQTIDDLEAFFITSPLLASVAGL